MEIHEAGRHETASGVDLPGCRGGRARSHSLDPIPGQRDVDDLRRTTNASVPDDHVHGDG